MAWKVLMIDDEKEDFFRISQKGLKYGLDIEYAEDLNSAEEILYKAPQKYSAIILDGEGKKSQNSNETINFIYMAQSMVEGVKRKANRHIPAIILTGHKDRLHNDEEIDLEVYSKLGEENKALEALLEKVKGIDVLPKAMKYINAKRIFQLPGMGNAIFNESNYNEMLKNNLKGLKTDFATIRMYIEYILKEWWFDHDDIFPWSNRNQISFGSYLNYLTGEYVPKETKPGYRYIQSGLVR